MKRRTHITLTEPQLEFLKLEAERLGISISDIVRRTVDQYREDTWRKIMQPLEEKK